VKRFAYLLFAVLTLTGVANHMAHASGRSEGEADLVFGITIPPGYRDWRLISVAHEEGNLNDLRALLGNDVAIKAFRAGKLPFPDGAIITRLAWSYVPSEENNKVFGQAQSFVPGAPTNIQFMVEDSAKYAAAGAVGARPTSLWPANSWKSSTTPSKTTGCSKTCPTSSWPPEKQAKT